MTEDDLDQVVAIEERSFAKPWRREAFRHELSIPFSRSVVAHRPSDPSLVVGYLVRWLVADEIHLLDVGVAPEARRAGLGRTLVETVIAEVRAGAAKVVLLEVSPRNAAAVALYRSLGFAPTRRRTDYYAPGDDAIQMQWTAD